MISEAREFLREATHGSPLWRVLASIAILLSLAALWIAFGLPPSSGFAWADEVEEKIDRKINEALAPVIETQMQQSAVLDDIQRRQLRQQIFDLQKTILTARKEQCTAWREGRNANYWTEQLSRLKQDYFDLTGHSADVPGNCAEI